MRLSGIDLHFTITRRLRFVLDCPDSNNKTGSLYRHLRTALLALSLVSSGGAMAQSASEVLEAPAGDEPSSLLEQIDISSPSQGEPGLREELSALRTSLDERQAALARTEERVDLVETRVTDLQQEFEELQTRLQTAGLDVSGEYAALLRKRLNRMEAQHLDSKVIAGIKNSLEDARIALFAVEELDAATTDAPSSTSAEALAADRRALIRALRDATAEHIDTLNALFEQVRELQALIRNYSNLLSERLFWLPSTDPMSLQTVRDTAAGFQWLAQRQHWQTLMLNIGPSMAGQPLAWVLTLALIGLLAARGVLRRRLLATANNVGHVRHDHFGLTLAALIYTVLRALPGSLALLLAGVLIQDNSAFGRALAQGLFDAALVFFLFWFLRHIATEGGLGHRHFRWSENVLLALRKSVVWLLLVLLPVVALGGMSRADIGELYQPSLGRLLFAIASIALAWFAHRIVSTIIEGTTDENPRRWLYLFYAATVAAPIAHMGLALIGYQHTAVALQSTLFITVCWIVGVNLLYYLAVRALGIRERRLALERLLAQRELDRSLSEAREAADNSGEGMPENLDTPDLDLDLINHQTHALLRMIVAGMALVGFWMLWSNFIPALAVFDELTLWTVPAVTEGGSAIPITLQDLLLALLIGTLTFFAARNLPGMLEVAVLSRLSLAPGSSYAVTTISTYGIVIIGIIMSLGAIGAQWSKLQWLVAALGVGLGFGLQEIVANFVSGLILLFERPVRVGDTVTVGEHTGTVSRIRIRATTLTDWDRKEQIIPNKTFVTQEVTNWTLSDSVTRVIIRVGVAYGSNINLVQGLLQELANANERVVADPPPAVFCVNFGDSSVDFEIRAFVTSILDIMLLGHEMRASIAAALAERGIVIPFPQRDIHIIGPANLPGTESSAGEAG